MNDEIQSLVEQLNAASDAYYNGREEIMTNYEWDAAFDRLKKLEEETGIILLVRKRNMSSLLYPSQRQRKWQNLQNGQRIDLFGSHGS